MMSSCIHSKSFSYYRALFVALFLLMGIMCAGIVIMQFMGTGIIATGSDVDNEAITVTLGFMASLGFFIAFIMLYLMRERRSFVHDRRKRHVTVNFADRRAQFDRRV